MSQKYDTLVVELFDAKAAGEPWTDEKIEDPTVPCLKFIVNGRELNEILVAIEDSIKGTHDTDPASVYGHVMVYSGFDFATNEEHLHGEIVNWDAQIGDDWVASVSVQITVTENEVIWHDFKNINEDWDYGLTYRFERKAYEEQARQMHEWGNAEYGTWIFTA